MDTSNPAYRHGHAGREGFSPTYYSWASAIQRITNPKRAMWKYYGGRGLTMHPAWLTSFDTFLADMGERPEGTSLGRIDPDIGYHPHNCRWETQREQSESIRRGRKHQERKALILLLVEGYPMLLSALYVLLQAHPECVRKAVRELQGEGLVTMVKVKGPGKTTRKLVKSCSFCGT